MTNIRDAINDKILAYEAAEKMLGEHEVAARNILEYARKQMLDVLGTVEREPRRAA